MIRVERGEEIKRRGVFAWRVPSLRLSGSSRQPLSDACRAICAILGETCRQEAGIYREGSDAPSMTCIASDGAKIRVTEGNVDGVRFGKWRPFDREETMEAAE